MIAIKNNWNVDNCFACCEEYGSSPIVCRIDSIMNSLNRLSGDNEYDYVEICLDKWECKFFWNNFTIILATYDKGEYIRTVNYFGDMMHSFLEPAFASVLISLPEYLENKIVINRLNLHGIILT